MKRLALVFLILFTAVAFASDSRVELKLDPSEADAVLAILEVRATGRQVTESDWQRLFTCGPYLRFKKREASLHRDFIDDDFRRFVQSEDLAKRAPALRHTLEVWKKADLRAAAERILPYLPADPRVKAGVYPVIKPKTNSFVFETDVNPAIFLYVDRTRASRNL
jgi:hypothetical protein